MENDDQLYGNPISDETFAIDSKYSYDQLYPMIDKDRNFERPSFANHRRSESAEKYFGWAGKTQRKCRRNKSCFFLRLSCLGPVEFLRGKRFWLFAKKDDGGMSAEVVPMVNVQPSSLTQGLWRSGIVGRRRRR